MIWSYIVNNLVALDQFVNTLIGGDPDMTLSGRFGRAIIENRCFLCKVICKVLDVFDKGHCVKQNEYEKDEGKDEVWRL